MKNGIVCDFDGCVVGKGGKRIEPAIGQILKEMHARTPITFVSARATEKSKSEALRALQEIDCGHIPILFRDREKFDHSKEGLTHYKIQTIQQLQETGQSFYLGIGDEDSDEAAYDACGFEVIRVQHVEEETLKDVWREIQIESLKKYAFQRIQELVGANWPLVSGVAFQGGIGRGRIDPHSDIDVLLAFTREEDRHKIICGELVIDGQAWSIFHLSHDRVTAKKWRDKLRYLYAYETAIVYDPDGELGHLCRTAELSDEEVRERVVYNIKKLGNKGITYQGMIGESWRGIHWHDKPDLWVRRHDLYAAHMNLHQAHELLLHLVYSLNRLPIPSPKWKYHLVSGLKWLPTDFAQLFPKTAMIQAMTQEAFEERYRLLVQLATECMEKAITLEMLPEDMGAYYFSRFSRHSDNTD